MPENYDVIIVGGAAAGLTAALYASRRNLKTLVIAKALGGQAVLTPAIENFPGIKKISGIDLMMNFAEHAQSYGAKIVYETVIKIEKTQEDFLIHTANKNVLRKARAVILAFGLTPKNLNVPGELEFTGKGVSYCATCDAPLYKKKSVAVVGGTYEALDAALLFAKQDCDVFLVHDQDNFGVFKKLFAQVQENKKIKVYLKTQVQKIHGHQVVTSIDVAVDGKAENISVAGVFVEKGHRIDSSWLGDLVARDKTQSIMINEECATKTPGLFAAGDVTQQRDKQVIISAGAGASAALAAYRYLQKIKGKPALLVDWQHES
ncbi:MAG: hypothetical protein A2233_01435 [Candidatus Kerfeldbacteria bacterium RIFOXYA2_FULL_38_24]|uniref:FAD/NAD(P)-binding domain-containing protein n=1 Tax=Candidatus Kerfeldbacteria bacterium RIFOXYB2_FULL_38_14 TaxID=1798547 RepID=A0A1G2BGR5_9BACT|nr:MAG: hypothetical protein A2233_01435 [Candidatus Kerfeldbacteria bacterium RIFOXYA2_FULL_38_24]OGY87397.1 MAG: hypothetical protein A2319_05525 [Candidatus Kerfeldbacteria bacterium RIFOXYB2_FULL_38_14]OGY90347.1 MAG: hypothetical protein A2458_04430 [Candidatus Kerfeldbacteria bacterium RIFOXYC2_FULL_38_9]